MKRTKSSDETGVAIEPQSLTSSTSSGTTGGRGRWALHFPLNSGDKRASTNIERMTHADECIECRGVLVQLDHADVIPADIRQEAELLLRESSGLAGFSEFVTDHTAG
jgi:hypothetical protein